MVIVVMDGFDVVDGGNDNKGQELADIADKKG